MLYIDCVCTFITFTVIDFPENVIDYYNRKYNRINIIYEFFVHLIEWPDCYILFSLVFHCKQ